MKNKILIQNKYTFTCKVQGRQSSDGRNYHGVVVFQPDGEAWRLRWELESDGLTKQFHGVGIETHDAFVASRAEFTSIPIDDDFPGVVVYDIRRFGHLPARWYHPTLDGRQGIGLSIDGPTDGLVGLYRAEYRSQAEEFEPLVKEIRARNDYLEFDWRSAEVSRYVGCGSVSGPSLAAAWSKPRASFDLIRYGIRQGMLQDRAETYTYGTRGGGWEQMIFSSK